jgi:hypothetical protein
VLEITESNKENSRNAVIASSSSKGWGKEAAKDLEE